MTENNANFNDGKSARTYPCNLVLSDDTLLIYLTGNDNSLIIWNFNSIVNCQLNGNSLIVTYGPFPHQSIECYGDMAKQIHNRWSGRNLVRNAEGVAFKGRLSIVITLVVLFFGVLLACYFFVVPWAGRKAADLIPLSAEEELGNSIAQVYDETADQNDTLNDLINEFVSKLKVPGPYKIKAAIIVSDEINAFALPGGKIFIYSGIINKMKSHEELVALLGHELTHVINRHSLKSICSSAASGIVIATMFGDVTGISSAVISQADEFKQLNYSRELETEADNEGYDFMLQNNVDPKGMLDLLKLLKDEGASMPMMMKYLSTHPDTDSRISNIEKKSKTGEKVYPDGELEVIFSEIKKNLSKTE